MKTTPARLLLALALGWSSLPAFAQAVTAPDSSFQRFLAQTTGVGKQTISFGSGGQVISSQGVPTLSTAGGPVEVSRTIPIRNPSGVPIPASAKVAVPPAVLGRALRGLAVSLPVIGTGIALYQVAQELGFLIEKPAGVNSPLEAQSSPAPGRCLTAQQLQPVRLHLMPVGLPT